MLTVKDKRTIATTIYKSPVKKRPATLGSFFTKRNRSEPSNTEDTDTYAGPRQPKLLNFPAQYVIPSEEKLRASTYHGINNSLCSNMML